jgi:hypothetical protein
LLANNATQTRPYLNLSEETRAEQAEEGRMQREETLRGQSWPTRGYIMVKPGTISIPDLDPTSVRIL